LKKLPTSKFRNIEENIFVMPWRYFTVTTTVVFLFFFWEAREIIILPMIGYSLVLTFWAIAHNKEKKEIDRYKNPRLKTSYQWPRERYSDKFWELKLDVLIPHTFVYLILSSLVGSVIGILYFFIVSLLN